MYRVLYEKGTPSNESRIVAELIERAIILASVDLDLTIQYLTDGVLAIVYLKPPHAVQWNVSWMHDQSKVVDTGMSPIPSLADPNIQALLAEDMKKIYIQLHTFCHCPACRMKGIL